MRRWVRRGIIGACSLVAVFAILLGAGWTALIAEDSGPVSARAHTMDDDALWMGHAWVDGRDGPADLSALVARLKTSGIRYLFVHSGPLSANGSLNPALAPRARWLTAALHRALPHVVVQAWLGDVVGGGGLDLASAATRARIVASARHILADGFDGVHLDLEPISTGDPGYLTLLRQVHRLTGQDGKQLSVSVPPVEPLSALHAIPLGHLWTTAYLHAVASTVDQVAIMTYVVPVPTSAGYAGFVHRETELALAAVPADVTLLIGVPAYRTTGVWPFSPAETVASAIRGVRLAISPDPPGRPLGVALYVDFTATAQDWASYQQDWVH
jgi:Glycosyl hydrolases family 18